MSYTKPEVVEFKKLCDDDMDVNGGEILVRMFAVLVDIRDALIPNNPNDKDTK